MAITKLNSSELYRKCDISKFDFTTTADLEERLSALGQDRAISAVELGINIKSKGYNLFCLGPEGTGKTSLVKRDTTLESIVAAAPDTIVTSETSLFISSPLWYSVTFEYSFRIKFANIFFRIDLLIPVFVFSEIK